MSTSQPSRPAASVIASAVAWLRTTVVDAVHSFYLSDFYEGRITLDGLERNARDLVRFGFVLLVAVLSLFTLADTVRARSELLVIDATAEGRAILLPDVMLPLTLFLLAIAWSFALTGALHCRRLISGGALALYLLGGVGWVQSIISRSDPDRFALSAAFGSLLGTAAFFAIRRRYAARPVLEFVVLLTLISVNFLIALNREMANQRGFGMSMVLAKVGFNVLYLRGLVTPLLLMIGVGIADFTRKISHWTSRTARRELPHWLTTSLFTALFAWRLYTAAVDSTAAMSGDDWTRRTAAFLGAVGGVAIVFVVFAIVARFGRRLAPPTERRTADAASRIAFPLVTAYSLVPLAIFLLLGLAMALPLGVQFSPIQAHVLAVAEFLNARAVTPWHYFTTAAAVVVALLWLRQGRKGAALYLGLFGAWGLWLLLTRRGGMLGVLYWPDHAVVELCWLVLVGGLVAYRLVRREFTAVYRLNVPFILIVLTFMRQRDFIENPFTPFLGFAGAAFVAFGLLWDIMTQGRWANGDSTSMPRIGRLLIYLGYALLAATVLNWAVVTHDLDSITKLTGGAALVGFDNFGKPLLYAVFAIHVYRSRRASHRRHLTEAG